MSLLRWIQGERSPASLARPVPRKTPVPAAPQRKTPVPGQRRTPVPAAPQVAAAEELLLPDTELTSAWLPASRRLFLPSPRPLRRGQRVSVLVRTDAGAGIPIGGEVVDLGPGDAVAVAVDEGRVPAVQRILDSLQGRGLKPRSRPPRYRVSLPAVVSSSSLHAYMTTFSLSQGGCGLLWTGPRPSRGTMVQVRLGSGSRSAAFHARVAWASDEGGPLRVGLRFVVGQDGALQQLLAGAQRDSAT
jgi:hypothetical protein